MLLLVKNTRGDVMSVEAESVRRVIPDPTTSATIIHFDMGDTVATFEPVEGVTDRVNHLILAQVFFQMKDKVMAWSAIGLAALPEDL